MEEQTTPVRPQHQFNAQKLQRYLAAKLQNVSEKATLSVRQYSSGQSNPTFLIQTEHKSFVLRKKPPGPLLPGAHKVDREYAVQKALHSAGFPVPQPLLYCSEPDVIGTAFYIMEHVQGRIFRDPRLPGVSPAERGALYVAAAEVLARLHSLNITTLGLLGYGKGAGYCRRQVSTWTKQYRASAHRSIPAMDQLSEWLSNNLPSSDDEVALVHGDFRIDNLIYHPTEARVIAVLDWELSTTGQPLADLAYFLMPHYCPSGLGAISNLGGVTGIEGVPPPEDLISIYCRCRGIHSALPHQNFFIALAMFKMACIAQGVYARYLLGNASAPNAADFGDTVEPLAQLALNIAHSSSSRIPVAQLSFLQSPKGHGVLQQVKQFMRQHVLPAQQQMNEYYTKHAEGPERWETPPVLNMLKMKARSAGLWNLFLPAVSGLSQVDYSYIAEETGRCIYGPEVFNCQAPDTGNMEVLHMFGTEEQKKLWLEPLLRAEIRSCFCMTEPDVASSDATNMECTLIKDEDHYIINGKKAWSSGKSSNLAVSTLPRHKGAATGYPEHLELDGTEVNEACISPPNHTETELKSPSSPVTMEISEQVGTENIIDFQMEVQDQEVPENNGVSAKDEQAHYEDDLLEFPTAEVMVDILTELPSEDTLDNEFENAPCPKEALVLEDPHDEFNRNESITSSVSDTPSSAESVYENEALRKRQDSVKEESSKNTVSIIKFSEDRDMREPLKTESHEDILEALACDEVEESMLEAYIQEEVMSDISAGSVHDPDDLEECLQVEIAAASSDSETDEKWRTIFSSSINKEDDDSYLDSLQLSAQELFIQKPEAKNEENHSDEKEEEQEDIPAEEDVLEQPESDSTYPQPTQEISYNPTPLFHGLSKISEDEEELGKSMINHKDTSGSCVKSDPSKKVPKDYCVIQEMKSENVSTEHVDFRVARNQWLQMEEQTKNLMYQPATKTGTCQGSHSFMYTPVRNIDRPKRDHDLENLALGREYSNTQFSPCSEDSGLGDSSYRSPYDDPETPVEKEIRSAMDREERLRRERGMSKSYSSDCVQGKGRPIILNPGSLCQEVDEKRKMLEHHEDNYRLSSSNKMPSFIITSSPTRGSQKHDYAGNNVIILEPESCHQSPHHSAKLVTSKSADWKSEDNPSVIILETSNLIIRSASEFNLNSSVETPEKTFLNNPFFKLRSRSTLSLLDEEIKTVKQREEELKRQRAKIYTKDNFLASPSLLDSSYDKQDDFPVKCKSSPSSPMKTYKMDRSTLSCDHRFPESYSGGRRKSAMALRWEAGEFANN